MGTQNSSSDRLFGASFPQVIRNRFRPRHGQAGFTLVELLVVITIIGILMSMVIPGVNAVRERARLADCGNKIRQLALAMNSYCSTHGVYPMNWGYTDKKDRDTVGHSWISMMLPQLDLLVLYQQIKFGEPLKYPQGASRKIANKNNEEVAFTTLPILQCPSDSGQGTSTTQDMLLNEDVPTTNYKAVCGGNWEINLFGVTTWTYGNKTQLCSNRGRNANVFQEGMCHDRGDGVMPRGGNTSTTAVASMKYYPTSDASVRDGLSNTFAIGETVPLWTNFAAWYWWNGAIGTCGLPLNLSRMDTQGNAASTRETDAQDYRYSYGFFSRHAAGANFAFCDSHIQFITESIDPNIYRALATISGGESVQPPQN